MEKNDSGCFQSKSIIGVIYRQVKNIIEEDTFKAGK